MCPASRITIRRLELHDVPRLIELCAEHAAYERSAFDLSNKDGCLRAALAGSVLMGWVAENSLELVGYATATIDFSTWTAEPFMHMDCLFVREAYRGNGLGRRLFEAVVVESGARGIRELQWQTPSWNIGADRFYRRRGALAQEKLRYRLQLAKAGAA